MAIDFTDLRAKAAEMGARLATITGARVVKTGDQVSGDLELVSGAKVTGLPAPTDLSDAVSKAYNESEISKSFPPGSIGQIPFISMDGTRRANADYLMRVGAFITTVDELNQAKNNVINNQTVFNSWLRFSHDTTETQPAQPTEVSSWTYDAATDTLTNTLNTNSYVGVVSTNKYSNYVLEARLSSVSGDDDIIGVLLAWYIDPVTGREYTLSAVRSPGGMGPTWALVYNHNRSDMWVVANGQGLVKWGNGVYGSTAAAAGYTSNQPIGGWDDFVAGTKVKITRDGDLITATTSQWTSPEVYDPVTYLSLDLTADPRLEKFRGPSQYGYTAMSQASAMWQILNFSEPSNVIVDVINNEVWVYDSATAQWYVDTTKTVTDVVGIGRLMHNPVTGKIFFNDPQAGVLDVLALNSKYVETDTNSVLVDKLNVKPSTTASAGINLGPGVAPTTAVDGDMWTTVSNLLIRLNGVLKTIAFTDSNITGSAAKLTTARTIALNGDVTGSAAFDGSANISIAGTLASTTVVAGSYGSSGSIATFTVDAKGRLTAAASVAASGTWGISITGNAGSVTNGLYSTGNYANPTWLTSLDASKLTGTVADARLAGTYTGFTYKFDGSSLPLRSPSAGSVSVAARTAVMPAEFKSASSAATGAIVFIAPNVNSTIMYQFGISGMLYNSTILDMVVQGYRTTGAWSALRKTNKGFTDIQVRLGVTPDGKNCLILGDVGTVWPYPHVFLKYMMTSHTNGGSDANVTGWTTALVTDLTGYTNVTADIPTNTMATDISGTADKASTLATAQNINGTPFDGSAAITTASWGTARNITIGGTAKSVNGSANISWSLAEIGAPGLTGAGASGTWGISISGNAATATGATNATNVAVTNDETSTADHHPLFAATTSGNNAAKAAFTKLTFNPSTGLLWASELGSGSDERLKHDWQTLPANFLENLAQVKYGTFKRTDNEDDAKDERYVGVSAQSLQPVLPDAVKSRSNGYLGVSYGSAAMVSVIALTQEVLALRERIAALEEKLNGSSV